MDGQPEQANAAVGALDRKRPAVNTHRPRRLERLGGERHGNDAEELAGWWSRQAGASNRNATAADAHAVAVVGHRADALVARRAIRWRSWAKLVAWPLPGRQRAITISTVPLRSPSTVTSARSTGRTALRFDIAAEADAALQAAPRSRRSAAKPLPIGEPSTASKVPR